MRSLVLLRHAKAVFVTAAQQHLSAGVALTCQGLHHLHNLVVLTDIIRCPGFIQRLICGFGGGSQHHASHAQAQGKYGDQQNCRTQFFHKASPLHTVFIPVWHGQTVVPQEPYGKAAT